MLLFLLSICEINTEICISLLYIDFNTYADDWHIRIVKRRLKFCIAYQSDRRKTTGAKSEKREKRKEKRKRRKIAWALRGIGARASWHESMSATVSLAVLFSHMACMPQINAQPFFNRRCLATLCGHEHRGNTGKFATAAQSCRGKCTGGYSFDES